MTVEVDKVVVTATWWEDVPEADPKTFIPDTEDIELRIRYEEDGFYIDGLRDGRYLEIPLYAIAQAVAISTEPPTPRRIVKEA